jgi:coenzyme F420-reducing hydrogenase beta subunit
MDRKEAKQIIEILFTADGGCKYCVADLLTLFCKEFPEYKRIAEKLFKEKFGVELEDLKRKRRRDD